MDDSFKFPNDDSLDSSWGSFSEDEDNMEKKKKTPEELSEGLKEELEANPPLKDLFRQVEALVGSDPPNWELVLIDLPRCLPRVSFTCEGKVIKASGENPKLTPLQKSVNFIKSVAEVFGEMLPAEVLKKFDNLQQNDLVSMMKGNRALAKTCSLLVTISQTVTAPSSADLALNKPGIDGDYYKLSYDLKSKKGGISSCIHYWCNDTLLFKLHIEVGLVMKEKFVVTGVTTSFTDIANLCTMFTESPEHIAVYNMWMDKYIKACDPNAAVPQRPEGKERKEKDSKERHQRGVHAPPGGFPPMGARRKKQQPAVFTPTISSRISAVYGDSPKALAAAETCSRAGVVSSQSEALKNLPIGLRNSLSGATVSHTQ
eukprot:CAMPEP_0177651666 /NCGR_PEP_ID=MMETSP0447-20121125/12684_1 /TAXON_ID=0 /ORGANISM="Stygamoeba regulata, Strain BSH-02190019" /LENGTH=371 /DNA_ID=CAMNT_0019154791 /DNA_START=212 /DNA_END=1328 /DNA_ORIENTATION=+